MCVRLCSPFDFTSVTLCSLPVDVVERALVHNREMVLVLAKAIGLQWETAMALLFLGAKEYRIGERDRAEMRRKFRRLDPEHLAAFYEYINRARTR